MIKNKLKIAVQNSLKSGEDLLWAGRPDPWTAFKSAIFIFLFGIPWTLFALAWETIAIYAAYNSILEPAKGPLLIILIFPIFGLPFVIIGIAMLLSPYYVYKTAAQTVHVITNLRILTITIKWPFGGYKISSFDAGKIAKIELNMKNDIYGDVKILTSRYQNSDGANNMETDSVNESYHIIYCIHDAREVETLLINNFIKNSRNNLD